MRLFFRDIFFHVKRTICLVRRKHLRERQVGTFVKRGFRPVALFQCEFCTEIRIPLMKQLGGKETT